MTMTIRILLLFAVTVCITVAQRPLSQRCLCRKVRGLNSGALKSLEDIQIFPPSQSCSRLEIVVNLKNGMQYCLDPKLKNVQNLLTLLMQVRNKPAPRTVPSPTEATLT